MDDKNRKNHRRWWNWIIYYDPDNPRTFVRRTVGFGVTINFATPLGKVIGVIFILIIVAAVIIKHR
ncbi:DUF5808 domain-containing protein [Alicyclobacillus fructus]|uniref:DUF5808 domain-containing protein n=1 Tax=Alicyclobacillus fructus TaxID=2816082 RepID=UPI001A8EC9AB|nr:DUF5808 domain-containing protein [Alicyclobacillus fructus]